MKRELKKQLKRLKREKQKRDILNKDKNKFWPSIYCIKEKIFIAFSISTVKVGISKYRIEPTHWTHENSKFRDPKYKIDFSKINIGQKVCCPHCKSDVDFRLWISSKRPEFY